MIRIPGSHVPNIKNRSSKHLICLTKVKPVVRSMSNEQLKQISYDSEAQQEITRRSNLHKKNK